MLKELTPLERNVLLARYGGQAGVARKLASDHIASFKMAFEKDPVGTYRNIFAKQG